MKKNAPIVGDEKYSGCFVAMPSFADNRVIAHGQNACVVREQAEKEGFERPVVTFVPANPICCY